MQREILFKGKRIDDGKWVSGFLYRTAGRAFIMWPYMESTSHSNIPDMMEVIPETVCQYTGLKDRTGKAIFEHDIVAFSIDGTYPYHKYRNRIGLVIYGEHNCSCCDGVYGWKFTENCDIREPYFHDVIGNKFDNPELVKEMEE